MPRTPHGGKRADFAQIALNVVERATGETLKIAEGKDEHAVALSAIGASKGGQARAAKLSANQRKRSARKAALARWAKKK